MVTSIAEAPTPATERSPAHPSLIAPVGYRTVSGRDLRYDLLRGFFVFAMVVDHILGPSWVHLITGGNRFFASAAEGFIFISGLLAGQVYRRLIDRDGLGGALQKLISRAGHLYALAVALTLIFLPLSEVLDLPWAQGVDRSNALTFVVSVLTLHRTYYLVDVPLLYALLLIVSPLAFILLSQGRTWIVLGSSWLLWGLYQVFPEFADLPWPIAGNYTFNFSAWQVLFFTALVMGYHEAAIRWFLRRIPGWLPLAVTAIGTATFVAFFLVFDNFTVSLAALDESALTQQQLRQLEVANTLFSKGDLGIGRLLVFALVFGFLFAAVTAFWRPVRRSTGWLLLPLGREALYAYTMHVIFVALAAIYLRPVIGYPGSRTLNTLVQLGAVLVIWLLIRYRILLPHAGNRRWFLLTPAVCVALTFVLFPWDPTPTLPGLEPPPAAANQTTSVVRAVRAFGTPTPKTPPAGIAPLPLPKPPPPQSQALPPADPQAGVSQFVGPLQGQLREAQFYSQALDAERTYFIYLPPDYGTAGRRYPVLYLLHGASGDKEEWPAMGLIDTADAMIANGEIPPLIIVLPSGDFGYWVDNVDGGPKWGEYVTRDLRRHVDSAYRTLPRARSRAIGGHSMGGFGALQAALLHPNHFGVVGAHSPSLRVNDTTLENLLGTGEEYSQRDPLTIAAVAPDVESLRIWLDVGEDDNFGERVTEFSTILAERGVEHELHRFPGEHGTEYWVEQIPNYLRFYAEALNR